MENRMNARKKTISTVSTDIRFVPHFNLTCKSWRDSLEVFLLYSPHTKLWLFSNKVLRLSFIFVYKEFSLWNCFLLLDYRRQNSTADIHQQQQHSNLRSIQSNETFSALASPSFGPFSFKDCSLCTAGSEITSGAEEAKENIEISPTLPNIDSWPSVVHLCNLH